MPRPDDQVPVGELMNRLRTAMFDAISEKDVREIVAALKERAKKGDLGATRLLFSYLIGSPSIQIQNAVVVTEPKTPEEPPIDVTPTDSLPGTSERIEAMARRVAKGLAIAHPRDRKMG